MMHDNSNMPRVLLIFRRYASSFTAYPWILARAGRLRVDVLAPERHMVRHSKWVDRHISAESDEAFIQCLVEQLAAFDYTSVLCVDEPSRQLLLGHRNLPELRGYLPFAPDSELNEIAVNKIKFQNWCERLGIECPRSVYVTEAGEVSAVAGQFAYPFVLKGALGAGGMCVDRIDNADDLKAVLEANAERKEWILQEYVEGEVGTTGFVAGERGLHALCSVTNCVCMGNGLGPSQVGRFLQDERLRTIAEKMTAQGGVCGITGFDWIQTAAGDFKVIDPHFGRAVPNMVVAHLDGVDLGEAYADSITGCPAVLREGGGSCIAYWLFPQSLQMIFEGGLWAALKRFPPWSRQVRLFFAGENEWRLFCAQSLEFLCGQTRVLLGSLRRRFKR